MSESWKTGLITQDHKAQFIYVLLISNVYPLLKPTSLTEANRLIQTHTQKKKKKKKKEKKKTPHTIIMSSELILRKGFTADLSSYFPPLPPSPSRTYLSCLEHAVTL